MKFSSKEDVEAPIEAVFAMLSEFETFERSAIRRGAEVIRVGDHHAPHVGQAWDARFQMRGRERQTRVTLVRYDPPSGMDFESESDGLTTLLEVELIALSQKRTRISVSFEVKPKTLSARLLVQSMRLAKAKLTKSFKLRVADYARDIEDRHRRLV